MNARALATLLGFLVAACSCAQDQGVGKEAHAEESHPKPKPVSIPRPPPTVTHYDPAREVEAIASEIAKGRKVHVLVQIQGLNQPPMSGLSTAGLKARRERMSSVQNSVVAALGHSAQSKDVTRIEGLPYVGFEFGPDELAALRKLQIRPGVFTLEAAGPGVTLRVERTQALGSQECMEPPPSGTSIADVLNRIEATQMSATGAGRVVVVIDSAVQSDAFQLAAHLSDPPGSVSGPVSLPVPAATSTAVTHGTKVACVLASAAPGCRIVPWNMRADDGAIQPDQVANVLSKLFLAEEPEFHDNLTAVCMSLAYQGVRVYDACSDPTLDSPMTAAFRETIGNLASRNVGVVIPAGNSDVLGCGYTFGPWCMDEAVCVAATDGATITPAGVTNWGSLVDVAAPGAGITVPIRVGAYPYSLTGTSIAVPFMAGALARLAEAHPNSTLAERIAALQQSGQAVIGCELAHAEIRIDSASTLLAASGPGGPTPSSPH